MKEKIIKLPIIFSLVIFIAVRILADLTERVFKIDPALKFIIRAMFVILTMFLCARVFTLKQLFITSVKRKDYRLLIIPGLLLTVSLICLSYTYGTDWITTRIVAINAGIGITEEGIFRSICFGLLLIKLKNVSGYAWKSALYSSLLFSLVHLVNLTKGSITTEHLLAVGFQMVYAFVLGFGFAGLTYKTNSIWIAVIIHSTLDLINNRALFKPDVSAFSYGFLENWFIPLFSLCFSILGYFYLRNWKQIKELEQER